MGSRLATVATVGLLVAVGAAAGDPGLDKARIDQRVADLQADVTRSNQRETVLTGQLTALSSRVRGLSSDLDAQESMLDELDRMLVRGRERLAEVDREIEVQTVRLRRLRRQHVAAVARLEQRVRDLYVTDTPDVLSFVLGAASFTDLLDNLELLGRIGRQDERIVQAVTAARDGVVDARQRTLVARREAARVQRAIATRASAQRDVVARLAANRDQLAAAEGDRRAALASIQEDRDETLGEIDALERQSAALAAQIRAAQQPAATTTTLPAGSGQLAWPVSGPVTSGYGTRWGRMHEGVDIAVPEGTPVHAAAAGTVIYAGWMEGYGNLAVIDHGGSLSTAYAHNSSLLVGIGQTVAAGDTIALSGSTGHSTGPHVHFEVRLGGAAVDPLGYL